MYRLFHSNPGPMTPSQMHASAATGQPLLATGPMPTQFIPYPQTPHAPHFQSQPYAPPMVSFRICLRRRDMRIIPFFFFFCFSCEILCPHV